MASANNTRTYLPATKMVTWLCVGCGARADKEHARGIRCGVVTICPRHIRHMGFKSWNGIEACGCTDDPADLHELHGLSFVRSAFGVSENTRRAD